jgi:xanthine dehydrogenase YagS FAD-binding subunit
MVPFSYTRADSAAAAVAAGRSGGAKFIGAGTNLVDLMRERVENPSVLVDVAGLSQTIHQTPAGGLLIGAAASNSVVAEHALVRERYPALSRAILAGASPQIRNMATVGGNVLQRTRCRYFYDVEGARCNKRTPGEGCDAIGGFNRYHAVLGSSAQCIATHPSDMCVTLVAFDAVVHLSGPVGNRTVPLAELHRLPGATPHIETVLQPGELIIAVELPPLPIAQHSAYRKVRDRSSYAFALISVAAALRVENGQVADVRLALGGVAHKPWRARKAEQMLIGRPATAESFLAAGRAEMADARPQEGNAFKPQLATRTIAAALRALAGEQA